MARIVVLAEKHLAPNSAKTAMGLLRYRPEEIVAVVDGTRAGVDVAEALGMDLGHGVPVLRNVRESLPLRPDSVAIGICPANDRLYPSWRAEIIDAVRAGLDVVNGLHFLLGDDEEIASLARRYGVRLHDVRRSDATPRVARLLPHRAGSRTILTVGADASSGKMTTALELDLMAKRKGLNSTFLATGQTGIMISGAGLPADAVVSDFLAGAVEEHTVAAASRHDYVFVEGQGALNHPAYSAVTLGIIHGARPDSLVLCLTAGQESLGSFPDRPIPDLASLIRMNEEAASWTDPSRPCTVTGISVRTQGLSHDDAVKAIAEIQERVDVPVTDSVRFGVGPLLDGWE